MTAQLEKLAFTIPEAEIGHAEKWLKEHRYHYRAWNTHWAAKAEKISVIILENETHAAEFRLTFG